MKKILITIMIGMFFISMVSADYIGKQYTDINIVDNCDVNGFPCPASYLCNITVSDPDLNLILLNQPMERNDTIYNFTIVDTDMLGDYAISIYCDNTTFSGIEKSILKVTTTGREPNMMITILLLISSLVLFGLAMYTHNHPMGFISGILFTISGMYIMIFGLGDLADMYTRSVGYVVISFGMFIVLMAGIEWMRE